MLKSLRTRIIVSVLMVVVLALVGCSSKPKEVTPPPAKTDIIFGTAGTTGTYYIVGAAMAQTVTARSSKINVVAQATKGSLENVNLTNAGEMHLGMSNSDGVYFGHFGKGTYASTGKQDIVGLMSLYMSAGQMVVRKDSGITSYADLRGKKVCLGPPSTTIIEMSKLLLTKHGVDPELDIKPYYLAFDEGLAKLLDGDLDATFFVAGTPTAALMNASSSGRVTLVDVEDSILDEIAAEFPYYEKYVIPGNTYTGITQDVRTLKIMTNIFASSKLSEEAAYEIVKHALEGIASYQDAHVVCREITAQTAWMVPVPLHPGAAKYYREIGVIK